VTHGAQAFLGPLLAAGPNWGKSGSENKVMAEHKKNDDHPQAPGLTAMAWFAIFLLVSLLSIVLFLQLKFGTPTAP
jgi:hypothetical protein